MMCNLGLILPYFTILCDEGSAAFINTQPVKVTGKWKDLSKPQQLKYMERLANYVGFG